MNNFDEKVKALFAKHQALISRKNEPVEESNGVYVRYKYPVLTAAHAPVFWRYDLDEKANPYLMERIGVNAVLNSGAIKWHGNICWLCAWRALTGNLSLRWRKARTG